MGNPVRVPWCFLKDLLIFRNMSREKTDPKTAEFSRKLGKRLCHLREAYGLTQAQVARKAGLDETTYYRYEHGRSRKTTPLNPKLNNLIALAAVFDMNVWELINLEEDIDINIERINRRENEAEWDAASKKFE